jgi:hypothetical protein
MRLESLKKTPARELTDLDWGLLNMYEPEVADEKRKELKADSQPKSNFVPYHLRRDLSKARENNANPEYCLGTA